ncbi:methionine ABC transporter ATP-binding protein [Bifidobacterium sp.]|uniref:methionine ABC transporter ATP-binding protein n=1 Tax=Bifidobacterium sp. TaxID=41200 RepID=UPI0025C63479|nr:ATP-binding cassette domain-containing protein [Bifidobacterium sp.]MCH4209825.1 ATP-binding cassette domain-containing protein [Bifidobacterium sp.]MCI1224554.1 ATP-binding cassette domain-containing protein [Bifidobacterium sp.]
MAEPIIEFSGVEKHYSGADQRHKALDGINLEVYPGEIFGVIGLSGAGKSTLVRCINGLEPVSAGTVRVKGEEVQALSRSGLLALRRHVGMIFQSFNLMPSRTVEDNVGLALVNSKLSQAARKARVRELLTLVELTGKEESYPADLSGGQQQRVAIARALADNPEILLSDESTSALDPLTTKSILRLLRRLNATLGITIIVITHQMAVVKEICDRVVVLENGRIIEQGDVYSIFADPQQQLTREFVESTSNLGKSADLEEAGVAFVEGARKTLVRLKYTTQVVSEALVSEASRRFGVDLNILFADVALIKGAPLGGIVVLIDADAVTKDQVLDYFRGKDVSVEVLASGAERPDATQSHAIQSVDCALQDYRRDEQ